VQRGEAQGLNGASDVGGPQLGKGQHPVHQGAVVHHRVALSCQPLKQSGRETKERLLQIARHSQYARLEQIVPKQIRLSKKAQSVHFLTHSSQHFVTFGVRTVRPSQRSTVNILSP
jgi:hypothetical protein